MLEIRSGAMKLCWMIFLVASAACSEELPRATPEYGAFALADESGTHLIAIGGMPGAALVHRSLCTDGSDVPVRFERRQAGQEGESRQAPSRFHRLAGDVFRIVRGKVDVSASCFLVGNGWISRATVVPVTADHGALCGSLVEQQLSGSRGRAVARCFSLGRLAGRGQLVLTEFAREGRDALASVALLEGGRPLFGDYPAQFRGDREDLWRVDDGGVLSADGFNVVLVVRRGGRYALGVSWAGTEGRLLVLFASGSSNVLNRVIQDYWYQAPE